MWQVKFINILFCYKHICSPLKLFSSKVGETKDGDQLHIQGTLAWCHIGCTSSIWCATAIADLDGLYGTLYQCVAKVDVGLDCLAKEVLSWSFHSRITFSPFPYCGLWKEATVLGHGKEWGVPPISPKQWICTNLFQIFGMVVWLLFPTY